MPVHKKKNPSKKRLRKKRPNEVSKDKKQSKVFKKSILSQYDKTGVKSLYSPFNKFSFLPRLAEKSKPKMSKSPLKFYGLTPKDKMYIITSCQSRLPRYMQLKTLAANAMRDHKVFAIYGSNDAVREALIQRDWVEKIPPSRMNLNRIRNGNYSSRSEINTELERLLLSSLVEKHPPDFIWRTTEDCRPPKNVIDMQIDYNSTIINKLTIDAMWTTKQGLCSSMKRNYWFYIEDVAEVNSPRTYNGYESGEIEGFISDFKITACTSLLKWVLSMVANDRKVFTRTGKISLNVIVFALNRCKEYLFRKQNKDIDGGVRTVSTGQWNAFLKKYYRIISKTEVFQPDMKKILPLCLSFAKFLLKEIHRYRPQLSCEGSHNIWIIKPAHCSRGRGIRMASQLSVITDILSNNSKFVVQKYIEEPLLIHETKFDIRQYYLITSTSPLAIWMYKDCYLKFSSQKYNLRNYHESIHLTNNAVQRKYKNCQDRHDELPLSNMWDSDKYRSYLSRIGKDDVWDTVIYPGMKKSIIGIMLSSQDELHVCKNRFELYGCDFILDKSYNPWLIEINSCPDLHHTTPVTARICPAVVADIIKVVIDLPNDPRASTGNFECIYRQPLTIPRYTGNSDLIVRGYSLPSEYFYKGKVEIVESYDNADIDKERDIKGIMKRIKTIYYEDIMLQPEPDCDCHEKHRIKDKTEMTESETELSEVATCITKQLDELLDRCTSESNLDLDAKHREVTRSNSAISANTMDVDSFADLNTTIKKSASALESTKIIHCEHEFDFSTLDDGPKGKGSWIDLTPLERVFYELSSSPNEEKCEQLQREIKKMKGIINSSKESQHDVVHAVANLILFMKQKESELQSSSSSNEKK